MNEQEAAVWVVNKMLAVVTDKLLLSVAYWNGSLFFTNVESNQWWWGRNVGSENRISAP